MWWAKQLPKNTEEPVEEIVLPVVNTVDSIELIEAPVQQTPEPLLVAETPPQPRPVMKNFIISEIHFIDGEVIKVCSAYRNFENGTTYWRSDKNIIIIETLNSSVKYVKHDVINAPENSREYGIIETTPKNIEPEKPASKLGEIE